MLDFQKYYPLTQLFSWKTTLTPKYVRSPKNPTLLDQFYMNWGGALVFELGYHPRKKITLGLFFRTRQCTRVHRLGVQNHAKLEKRVCFCYTDKLWKGHAGQIKKNACKYVYLGSIFIPVKYVFRVCFKSPFKRMISSLKYKWPRGMNLIHFSRYARTVLDCEKKGTLFTFLDVYSKQAECCACFPCIRPTTAHSNHWTL